VGGGGGGGGRLIPYREQADVQAVTELKEKLKRLHGRKTAHWNLACTLYLHSYAGQFAAAGKQLLSCTLCCTLSLSALCTLHSALLLELSGC